MATKTDIDWKKKHDELEEEYLEEMRQVRIALRRISTHPIPRGLKRSGLGVLNSYNEVKAIAAKALEKIE